MRSSHTEALNLFDDFGGFGMSNANVMDEYAEKKVKGKVAFEEIQATGEYMETHYFHQKSYGESKNLLSVNGFWHDYALYLLNREGK
jgi:hypothetical protein